MNKELRDLIEGDRTRNYGKTKLSLHESWMKPPQIKYLECYRKAAFYGKKTVRGIWFRLRLSRLSNHTQIQIPTAATIGKGLYIGHFGRIILHPEVVLGNNVNLSTGITIGTTRRGDKKGTPVIGNEVWIGTNAVIVGSITIGDDVLIAPNAYVNTDIPAHSIVLGNPAVIHHSDKATDGYINHKVI